MSKREYTYGLCRCGANIASPEPDTVAEDMLAELRRERDELRAMLRDALLSAEEGWTYASDYFRDKWMDAERLDEIRRALNPTEVDG